MMSHDISSVESVINMENSNPTVTDLFSSTKSHVNYLLRCVSYSASVLDNTEFNMEKGSFQKKTVRNNELHEFRN